MASAQAAARQAPGAGEAEGPESGRGRTERVPAGRRSGGRRPPECGRNGWRGVTPPPLGAGAPQLRRSLQGAVMALWRSGALALWRSGALALWRWRSLWRSGALALWRSGALALWRSGALALWRSGALALWRSGALALWRSGAIVSSGRFRTVNLFPYSAAMGAPPDRQRAMHRAAAARGAEPARIVPFLGECL